MSILCFFAHSTPSSDTSFAASTLPAAVDTHTLRAHVATLLHSPPVSAKDPSGRPLNFQLWLSQQDSRPPGYRGGGGCNGGGPNPANRRIYHNRRRGQWPFARLVIPLAQAARDLLAETKIRPITAHGKKLKFVPGTASPTTSTGSSGGKKSKRNHNGVPLDVVRRLLAVPYGGRKTIQLEETAETLRRGRNCHLFELGTINRDGEFAKEHTVYDANTVKMVPSIIPRRKKFTRNDKGEKIIIESTNDDKPTFRPDKVPEARCVLACEAGFRGMQIKILKPGRVMTFRLQPRTIEQICWSPSSLPSPPPSWQPRPKPHVEQTELNEIPEAQDVIIRLSQPLILEKKDTTTNIRHRLSELPSKPHISPYCFNTIFISGYNLVETLESMSKMYGTPMPWELHLQRSSWRRYRLSALRMVEEKMQDMPLALAFQYQVDLFLSDTFA